MKIIVLGGDGFCGWPTSLHLSNLGHEVTIIDNLSRRKIDIDLETNSLTPIKPLNSRLKTWEAITSKKINFLNIDVAKDYELIKKAFLDIKPEAIIHFAEQRSAPYSMLSDISKRYTVNNNVNATHNVLVAISEVNKNIHLIHLGTMGVYGYGQTGKNPIPEGYLEIKIDQPDGSQISKEILYPAAPGSIYHTTKTLDALLFYFYNKNDNLRITDLHQGIVWGTNTRETSLHEDLINRFDYDGDYGTVLNRFLMQSAINHPLTVHGTGEQTRAFIHIQDSVKCLEIALNNPPKHQDKVQIFNQMSESKRLIDLANMVSKLTGAEILLLKNPRKEADNNELNVINNKFISYGLSPLKLSENLMHEVTEITKKFAYRINKDKIIAKAKW